MVIQETTVTEGPHAGDNSHRTDAEVVSDKSSTGEALAVQELLEACPDDRLLPALPSLLRALPTPARTRCLIAVRLALQHELTVGWLDGGDAWRRALAVPVAYADAKKRPIRAMAMPFVSGVASSAPKRAKVEADSSEAVAHGDEDDVSSAMAGPTEAATSVYVANLPYSASEDVIRSFFETRCSLGSVKGVRMLRSPTGESKGAAVVIFDVSQAASKALLSDGDLFEGRPLIVREDTRPTAKGEGGTAKGNDAKGKGRGRGKGERQTEVEGKASGSSEINSRSVVVKNLAFSASEANIGELFAGCGEVSAVRIAKDTRSGRPRGFAVVEFSSTDAVSQALRRGGQAIRGRAVRVEALGVTEQSAEMCKDVDIMDSSEQPKNATADPEAVAFNCRTSGIEDASAKQDGIAESQNSMDTSPCIADSGQQDKVNKVGDALQRHAQQLVSRAARSESAENAVETNIKDAMKKRGRGAMTPLLESYPDGEEGLNAARALANAHATAEELLAAEGAEAIKGRLGALGLKAGGAPLERAKRMLQLGGIDSLAKVPKELMAKGFGAGIDVVKAGESATVGRSDNPFAKGIKFVKAGATESIRTQEDVRVDVKDAAGPELEKAECVQTKVQICN